MRRKVLYVTLQLFALSLICFGVGKFGAIFGASPGHMKIAWFCGLGCGVLTLAALSRVLFMKIMRADQLRFVGVVGEFSLRKSEWDTCTYFVSFDRNPDGSDNEKRYHFVWVNEAGDEVTTVLPVEYVNVKEKKGQPFPIVSFYFMEAEGKKCGFSASFRTKATWFLDAMNMSQTGFSGVTVTISPEQLKNEVRLK
jgi:hypothetical protein